MITPVFAILQFAFHIYCNYEGFIWAAAWDFQQFDILTSVASDEPLQPPFKLRNSKWCSSSSLPIIEYSSDRQRLWSDCAYAQADLSLCWSHIPNCWKFHALAHLQVKHRKTSVYMLDVYEKFLYVSARQHNILGEAYCFKHLFTAKYWCLVFDISYHWNQNIVYAQGVIAFFF